MMMIATLRIDTNINWLTTNAVSVCGLTRVNQLKKLF